MGRLTREITAWCCGRFWPARALLLVFIAYVGFRHLINPQYASLFNALNLGIHEAGHLLFYYTGSEFLCVAGGTILQLLAPVAAMIMFWRQPDYFAICVCGAWLSTNLYGVATYAGDARAQGLTRVSLGGGPGKHDWQYLLSRLDMLAWDTTMAGATRAVAFLVMWSSIIAGIWLVVTMAFGGSREEAPVIRRVTINPKP
jgi:hypothetical protein